MQAKAPVPGVGDGSFWRVGECSVTNVAAPISVFLLAQNRLLREALAKILSRKNNDAVVVGSCALSGNSIKEVLAASPDVLVMDSFATSVAHVEFAREVQARIAGLKLVMIGMEADEQMFLRAIREGALGYVL